MFSIHIFGVIPPVVLHDDLDEIIVRFVIF